MVFTTGDPLLVSPARWVTLPLRTVGSGMSCLDGSSGVTLATVIDPMGVTIGEISIGAPVRVFEPMEVRLYPSLGAHWLGVRSLSTGGNLQPALGPLTADGLELRFFDGAGGTTTDPSRVAGVHVTLRARSAERIRRGLRNPRGWFSDSLTITLTARNR